MPITLETICVSYKGRKRFLQLHEPLDPSKTQHIAGKVYEVLANRLRRYSPTTNLHYALISGTPWTPYGDEERALSVAAIGSDDGSVSGEFIFRFHSPGRGDFLQFDLELDSQRFTQEQRDDVERFLKSQKSNGLLKDYTESAESKI